MKHYLTFTTCLVIVVLSFVAGCQEEMQSSDMPIVEEQSPPPAEKKVVVEEKAIAEMPEPEKVVAVEPKAEKSVAEPAVVEEKPEVEKPTPEPKAAAEKPKEAKKPVADSEKPKPLTKPKPEPKAASQKFEGIEAIVNGKPITTEEVRGRLKRSFEKIDEQLPEAVRDRAKQQEIGKEVQNTIDRRLIEKQIEKAGIVVSDQDVNNYINQKLSDANMTMEQLVEKIEADGLSYDEWKVEMNFPMMIGFEKLIEKLFSSEIKVEPNEVSDFYNQNPKYFNLPEQVQATHILVKVKKGVDPNDSRKQAEAILSQIKAGADFDELAKKYASAGKDAPVISEELGFFTREKMVKPFSDAAFDMSVGDVSDEVVNTRFGYHIIKVTGRKDPEIVTLEKAGKDIENFLKGKKQQKVVNEYKAELRKEANIVYPPGKDPKDQRPARRPIPPRPGAASRPRTRPAPPKPAK